MPYQDEQIQSDDVSQQDGDAFDYSFVHSTARIAVYDDMKMAPHVLEIAPAPTNDFIESLATRINDEKNKMGGKIPYSVIREVSENFIHARFSEMVVSIFDNGNTIRFCDQGPGISNKDKAQLPGYTSAVEPMKHYIRGVGSGFPLIKEYLDISNGEISIDDNLNSGSVVTISLNKKTEPVETVKEPTVPVPPLTDREKQSLHVFLTEGALGVTELSSLTAFPQSSVYNIMGKLQEDHLIEKTINKKRILTDYGFVVAQQLEKNR